VQRLPHAADGSDDFGARRFDDSGVLKVHDHQFPAANTALPQLLNYPGWVNQAHLKFLDGVVRVDLSPEDRGNIDGELAAPLRPAVPVLEPGRRYLLETGDSHRQDGAPADSGDADSNELDGRRAEKAAIDRGPQRRDGRRRRGRPVVALRQRLHASIRRQPDRRRNPQDIFTPLYNNQIRPARPTRALRVHRAARLKAPIEVEVRLQYRKSTGPTSSTSKGDPGAKDRCRWSRSRPDRITFPVKGSATRGGQSAFQVDPWQRWNDYGIGLLRKADAASFPAEAASPSREAWGAVMARSTGPGYSCAKAGSTMRPPRGARVRAKVPAYSLVSDLVQRAGQQAETGGSTRRFANFEDVVATTSRSAQRQFDFGKDYHRAR